MQKRCQQDNVQEQCIDQCAENGIAELMCGIPGSRINKVMIFS